MTTPSASTATASGSAAMLRETYELRAHAVDRLRVLLHEKLAREGLSAQALLDAGATPTPTAATTIAAGNASASSNSVSSTTTTAAASRGDGGRRSFMCWLCAKVTSVIYRVRNTYELCFTCFRMFYISAVLPLLDTPERRRSDVDFLHRIALLQTHTPTSRGAAAASSSSMQHNCSSSTGGGGGNADEWAMTTRTAAAAAHRTARGRGDGDDASILDVSDPSQASFVMNASVMLQRRTAANAHVFGDIASYARNPCAVATSNNNSSGGGGSATAAASPVVATTTATTAADARVSARAAPASMWSCRQCTYINPETARVCEVCGCAFVDSVTCRVCGKVCSMATLASYAQNGNNHNNNNSSSSSGSFAAADDDKADALSAAAGAAGSAVVTRSSRSNSATSGSGSSGGGLGVCKDGRPHLLWSCAQCQGINTLDGDVCALCRQPRYWVCGYCTDRHSAQRVTDGLRYCVTCGSYNTPDDLKKGQSKVDYEVLKQQQQHEEAAAAARQQRERALSSSSLSLSAAAAAAATAAGATTGGGDATVFGVNDADTLAQLRRQREIADNESRLNERLRALQIARNVRKSDGNCLFAALAHQLFGKASMCHTVRSMIVHYMRMHADDYAVLFTAREWERYISQMRESGFWGDELCLNAAARCFHVDIHVITSDPARWHIVFHHKDLSMSQSYRGRGSAGDRRHNNNKSNSDDKSSGSRGLTTTTTTATRTLPAVLGHGDDSQHSQQQQHYQGKRYSSSGIGSGNNNNNSSSSTSAVASAALHSTLHQDLPVLRAACGAPDDAAATAERLVRQGRDVVSPRAGEPESVCVFLAYLSPVHYDDIGLSAAPPVRLPELFVKEVRQTLATMLTSSPSVTTTATTTTASSPLVVALSSPLARHKGSISSNNNSGSRSSLTAAMLSAQQPPSQHSSTATTAAVQRRSSAMHLHGGKTPTQPPTLP